VIVKVCFHMKCFLSFASFLKEYSIDRIVDNALCWFSSDKFR
jgi:hypothetical protein